VLDVAALFDDAKGRGRRAEEARLDDVEPRRPLHAAVIELIAALMAGAGRV
jgi:hypothetical protein